MESTTETRPRPPVPVAPVHSASTSNLERRGGLAEPEASALPPRPASTNATRTQIDRAATALEDPDLPRVLVPAEIVPHPMVDGLIEKHHRKGVLIPLKTTLELRQDHTLVQAYITRAPTKAANNVVSLLRDLLPDGKANTLPHLRRCAKPGDMPAHLKTHLMNETAAGRLVHTGRSNWIYILIGEVKEVDPDSISEQLKQVEGMDASEPLFVTSIPVPLVAPTSQVQAALWTSHFWPTVYRKNNPLGPHPAMLGRATDEIRNDASVWMALAHEIALKGYALGLGEASAAVVVQRANDKVHLVAVAADARWHQDSDRSDTGNPMAHCVLRAISMVAQKLVRYEHNRRQEEDSATDDGEGYGEAGTKAAADVLTPPSLMFDTLQDAPLFDDEAAAFELEHPNPDGYLCHGLEMYVTHEPCVQCSMAVLHSRMGKLVFGERMHLTGGMTSEDRGAGHPDLEGCNGGHGLGLFWRRELNWSLMAWEWEAGNGLPELPVMDHCVHA